MSNLYYVLYFLLVDLRKEFVFVEIFWVIRYKREIKFYDYELKCSFFLIKNNCDNVVFFFGCG